ncbi:UPF0149 family protein [uncultured Porticoccus sp.]|uniref:UPF0149 family protein n=1 Tax=uncultured Porticoccus sp. TaxID=1256050 RepID=UPI00261B12CE|nr:UPF0149 family protein [uncultured Porticoccus sp.]
MNMDFNDIADAFLRANLPGSPAELHGLLCGRISGGQHAGGEELITMVCQLLDVVTERVEDLGDVLPDLHLFSLESISSGTYEFQPLLPGDEVELNQRLLSLGEWCQGFLFGLGSAGLSDDTTLTGDIADALGDLAAISQIGTLDEESEEDEVSYTELVEYVRVAVLLVYAELNKKVDDPLSPTLH